MWAIYRKVDHRAVPFHSFCMHDLFQTFPTEIANEVGEELCFWCQSHPCKSHSTIIPLLNRPMNHDVMCANQTICCVQKAFQKKIVFDSGIGVFCNVIRGSYDIQAWHFFQSTSNWQYFIRMEISTKGLEIFGNIQKLFAHTGLGAWGLWDELVYSTVVVE